MIRKTLDRMRGNKRQDKTPDPTAAVAEADKQPQKQRQAQDAPTPKDLANAPRPITRFSSQMPSIPLRQSDATIEPKTKPRISFVVIVYKMSEQAKKTLRSLCADYQLDVNAADYEIVVVENTSTEVMGEQAATEIAGNIRYFLREDATKTPVTLARRKHAAIILPSSSTAHVWSRPG